MTLLSFRKILVIFFIISSYAQAHDITLTVFMHGSIAVELHLPNYPEVTHDTLTDACWCVGVTARLREDPLLFNEQTMLRKGLVLIPDEKIKAAAEGKLCGNDSTISCYYTIAAYDAVVATLGINGGCRYYATFGWSGLLSQQRRKDAGFAFYDELVRFCSWCYKKHGVVPKIDVITHSHGGSAALWLAKAEKVRQKKLKIRLLLTLGMPVQQEVAACIESPVFYAIINGYSYGDKVQKRDRFSTKGNSYRCLNDIIDLRALKKQKPDLIRSDMMLVARHELHRIDHSNMWLMAKSSRIFPWLDPMPLVVLCPLIVAHIDDCRNATQFLACFHGEDRNCFMVLNERCEHGNYKTLTKTHNIYDPIANIVKATRSTWCNQDFSRHSLLNRRGLRSLMYALKGPNRKRCTRRPKRTN